MDLIHQIKKESSKSDSFRGTLLFKACFTATTEGLIVFNVAGSIILAEYIFSLFLIKVALQRLNLQSEQYLVFIAANNCKAYLHERIVTGGPKKWAKLLGASN